MAENPRIEELRRRVQADPASIAFAALAEEFRRVGRYEDAIETCRSGLQRHPAYMSARVTLGRALVETGDYEGAREEFDIVLRSAPENLAAIRGLAQIHERLGHSTEMDPSLAAMMQEPIRLAAAPPPAPEPPALPPPALPPPVASQREAPAPVPAPPLAAPAPSFDTFDLAPSTEEVPVGSPAESPVDEREEPFDIFGAALKQRADPPAPPPAARVETLEPSSAPAPIEVVEPAPAPVEPFEPPVIAFEPATIAFERPVLIPEAAARDVGARPDPHVASTLVRLERLLGAIESARHA